MRNRSFRHTVLAVATVFALSLTGLDATAFPGMPPNTGAAEMALPAPGLVNRGVPALPNKKSPCVDAIFLGARGTGQVATDHDGFGSEVAAALQMWDRKISAEHRLASRAVDYDSNSAGVLLTDPGKYFNDLDAGVDAVVNFLALRARMCPKEHYVLAGYSQGAMVMHRALWELADGSIPLSRARIDGLILIADGDRYGETGHDYGSADTPRRGVSFKFPRRAGIRHKPQARLIPARVRDRSYSICDHGDIVCDPNNPVPHPVRVHTTHYQPGGEADGYVLRAASKVAAVTNSRPPIPPMRIMADLPSATVGQDYYARITAAGGAGPYTFSAPLGLPEGFHLATDGTLTGQPTSLPVSFTVQAQDANRQIIKRRVEVRPLLHDVGTPIFPVGPAGYMTEVVGIDCPPAPPEYIQVFFADSDYAGGGSYGRGGARPIAATNASPVGSTTAEGVCFHERSDLSGFPTLVMTYEAPVTATPGPELSVPDTVYPGQDVTVTGGAVSCGPPDEPVEAFVDMWHLDSGVTATAHTTSESGTWSVRFTVPAEATAGDTIRFTADCRPLYGAQSWWTFQYEGTSRMISDAPTVRR